MAKGVGRKIRSKQNFRYDVNRRRENKKRKRMPTIDCALIKKSWSKGKSSQANFEDMGLSFNPNKTLPIPKAKDILGYRSLEAEKMEVGSKKKKPCKKAHVVEGLEEQAKEGGKRPRSMPEEEVKYCVFMMEKYGEDYEKMARDYRNYYQDTPYQIQKKIMKFKNMEKQYKKYLANKSSNSTETNTTNTDSNMEVQT
ncbi:nucleolar protein 16-like [Argonauta hians]